MASSRRAFRSGNTVIAGLNFGRQPDWYQNIKAAGTRRMRLRGEQLTLGAPALVPAAQGVTDLPWLVRKLPDDYAQPAQTCRDCASGIADACGPGSPDSHRVVWGLTSRPPVPPAGFPPVSRLPAGFSPVARLPPVSHRPAFSGSSPSAVAQVPVPLGVPPGSLPLGNPHDSAAAGRFRRRWSRAARAKVTSPAATLPFLDLACSPGRPVRIAVENCHRRPVRPVPAPSPARRHDQAPRHQHPGPPDPHQEHRPRRARPADHQRPDQRSQEPVRSVRRADDGRKRAGRLPPEPSGATIHLAAVSAEPAGRAGSRRSPIVRFRRGCRRPEPDP